MTNDVVYKILDLKNGQFVELISSNGDIVNSVNGIRFDTYSSALDFLHKSQMNILSHRGYISLTRFEIHQLRLEIQEIIKVSNFIESTIISKPENKECQEWFKSIIIQAVRYGFCEIDQILLNFAFTNDKYYSILVEYVPPHMLQCIDEFMNVGINECDLDTLGSISLTASQKQLKIYDIEWLFSIRTEKCSK